MKRVIKDKRVGGGSIAISIGRIIIGGISVRINAIFLVFIISQGVRISIIIFIIIGGISFGGISVGVVFFLLIFFGVGGDFAIAIAIVQGEMNIFSISSIIVSRIGGTIIIIVSSIGGISIGGISVGDHIF